MAGMASSSNLSLSQKVFRGLLRALPADFRANFGHEMEGVFAEQKRDVEQRGGPLDFLKLWWETFVGIFRTAPREHWDILKQDCAYAFRMMRKNIGFTVIAVLTLALGIGANTAIFSVVHAVLLRPLPYPEGQQLVFIRQQAQREGIGDIAFSVHEIQDYREQNRTLSGLVEYHSMSFILFGHGDPDRVRAAVVSSNYFDLFGVKPLLGRTFLPDDDTFGAPPVLILSYDYWKTTFGSDPDIVGKTFELNDKVHTVVGVLPPVPQYPVDSDVYMPTSACPFRSAKAFIENRDSRMMEAFARLKPGVSIAEARADLATISDRLRSEYPKSYPEQMGYAAVTSPLREELTHDARPTLLILLAAAAFVLLIACANVTNLTLARTSRRERELAVRTALGAGRGRLLRQLLTESLILALMGGLLALVFASNSLQLLADFAARLTPRAHEIRMDTSALLLTLVAALGTSVLFGTLAALFSRANLTSGLKEGTSGAGTGRRKNRVRGALIVSQIAFSFILLIGAALMLRSLQKLLTVDAGFSAQHVLAMRTTFSFSKYASGDQLTLVGKKVLDRVQGVRGVLSASLSSVYPLEPEAIVVGSSAFSGPFRIEGRDLRPGEAPPVTSQIVVSPGYFQTLGIPLREGRLLADTDDGKHQSVALINEAAKRQFWPHEDPIGKRIKGENSSQWTTVVGVVGDVRDFGLEHPAVAEFYVPQGEAPSPNALLVRTAVDPASVALAVASAVHDVDSQAAVTHTLTLEQARSDSTAAPRVIASLLGIFGALALLIAAAGIGGIMALTVSQRFKEMGVRMALGAQPSAILRMILRQSLVLTVLGVAIGAIGALAMTGLFKSRLFQVAPTDPVTFIVVALVLIASALLASFLPARRAASIDPIVALRNE
jgi:putative ABC transport system permease protein